MRITLNNRPEELSCPALTVAELLQVKKFSFKLLVIKINGKLVKKEEYGKATIRDGDDVSVLHLISGG